MHIVVARIHLDWISVLIRFFFIIYVRLVIVCGTNDTAFPLNNDMTDENILEMFGFYLPILVREIKLLYPWVKIGIPKVPANHQASGDLIYRVNTWLFNYCDFNDVSFLRYEAIIGRDGLHLSDNGKINLIHAVEKFQSENNQVQQNIVRLLQF